MLVLKGQGENVLLEPSEDSSLGEGPDRRDLQSGKNVGAAGGPEVRKEQVRNAQPLPPSSLQALASTSH